MGAEFDFDDVETDTGFEDPRLTKWAYEEICRNPEIDPQTAYGIALRKLRNMKKENYGK